MPDAQTDFSKLPWSEKIKGMDSGKKFEVDHAFFEYFLGVLPPAYMDRWIVLDGQSVHASFGFAEGEDNITAFWRETVDGLTHYYCQRTSEVRELEYD